MGESRSPLGFPAYRAIWIAATFSNVGTFVQDVAQSWLMLTLTKSAMFVALLTVCYTFPIFVLSIPAGVIADRVDRRRMLMLSQTLAAATSLTLAAARALGLVGGYALLVSALVMGVTTALSNPPWLSLVPELVPRKYLPEAIAWNAVSFNLARVLGPALGGFLLGTVGAGFSFFVNGVSFLAIVVVLAFHREIRLISSSAPKADANEEMGAAIRAGFRVVFRDEKIRACTTSVMTFAAAASMTMSVLPVFAESALRSDAKGYGTILGALGLGAVAGAPIMRRARPLVHARSYAAMSMALFASAILVVAIGRTLLVARVAFVFAGLGWVGTFSTLMALVQTYTPAASRSRVLSIYGVSWLFVWMLAALAAGWIARHFDVKYSLFGSAIFGYLASFKTALSKVPNHVAHVDAPQTPSVSAR